MIVELEAREKNAKENDEGGKDTWHLEKEKEPTIFPALLSVSQLSTEHSVFFFLSFLSCHRPIGPFNLLLSVSDLLDRLI
jgi:hypothetical protein